jgi:hypothetical protein
MNYLKVYCNLIRKAENRTPPEGYTEKHHTFPVSIFGKNKRIVVLTAREHYIAHALLERVYIKRYGIGDERTKKMTYSHWMMKVGKDGRHKRYYNSILYENLKIRMGKSLSGKNNPFYGKNHTEEMVKFFSESQKGEKHHYYGKYLSTEHRTKIGDAHRGKNKPPLTEEHKEKLRQASTGKTHTEKTKLKMSLLKSGKNNHNYGKELTIECKRKLSENMKNKKWWNNGEICVRSEKCPGDGWVRGRKLKWDT